MNIIVNVGKGLIVGAGVIIVFVTSTVRVWAKRQEREINKISKANADYYDDEFFI